MGSGRWDPDAYATFSLSTRGRATSGLGGVYGASAARVAAGMSAMSDKLEPKGVKVRESRDSALNPSSTPLIVALDVTGSMGMIADVIARTGLGTLFKEVLDRKPISDPHIAFMAIGDANFDRHPLQVSQFEADTRIIDQLVDIYLEHGGGGNNFENYNLAWYFAAYHTAHDAIEKRGKKGYLFTVGDEEAPGALTKEQIAKFIGDTPETAPSNADLLELAGRKYEIFHVIVEEGNHASSYPDRVRGSWTSILGQRAIPLADHTKLAEVIVSAIEVNEGRDKDAVAKSWGSGTDLVVAKAVGGLVAGTGTAAGPATL